jgi:acyl transferase domain-containing protein/NAD(P)H-dependent flavin oxidoreductase YrpB (nitropropane dioxygenase family)/NAD(P)-dependent dehydrogenase (short-subunit alcohol dehydrogenase family)/acyl carrier protein
VLFQKSHSRKFWNLVYTPAGLDDATLAIAACRAGGVGILNAEFSNSYKQFESSLDLLAKKARANWGLKLDRLDDQLISVVEDYSQRGLKCLILESDLVQLNKKWINNLKARGVAVLAELFSPNQPSFDLDEIVDGIILKGNESGGMVGENSSFILMQKWLHQTRLPILLRGGISPHVAAACAAVGVAGGVLDSQILLLQESPIAEDLTPIIEHLSGNETAAVGNSDSGEYFRLLLRPNYETANRFSIEGDGKNAAALKQLVQGNINWKTPKSGLLPLGQDVCMAKQWGRQRMRMSDIIRIMESAVDTYLEIAVNHKPLSGSGALAKSLKIPLPVVQGPMARVSDNVEFATSVANAGGLPVFALSLSRAEEMDPLLSRAAAEIDSHSWGVGLLGFAPQEILNEQLAVIKNHKPRFAVIAGGSPEQTKQLEQMGVISFLHVPSPELLHIFLQEGANRFIFEGRECGGHIGPLSSFVLWSRMIDCLLAEIDQNTNKETEIFVLFAGGIHDATSAAFVQVISAPLLRKGVKIGIQMGTSYLFTHEIVNSGALSRAFQNNAINCEHTVCLQSGPGHVSRCAFTPFAKKFVQKRNELLQSQVPADQRRERLDKLVTGRLMLASKGCFFDDNFTLQKFDECHQQEEGMYMLGQLAILRSMAISVADLHHDVCHSATAFLTERLDLKRPAKKRRTIKPADIAIIGMAAVLPKADSIEAYWDNILSRVVAVDEIPAHRWDWRLYYDENRQAKDKIYSRWGGFIDDLVFDPILFGIPPKSIPFIDPIQLMALEIARQTLADAGYESRQFDREHASVIIGASGGISDVGMQYGLRTELPRFQGRLPDSLAERLPEWSEDTFAGILANVIAGRIANRFNLGGVNCTIDAACASSMAALYLGVTELVTGRSNLVIAGGVDSSQGPFGYMCFSRTQALSPTGRCSTFDASADGIVIAEGIAMIALKRLRDAEKDGDRIYGVIKGIGASSDGRSKGLTAPEPRGQLRAMQRAYAQSGFSPGSVTLFEAHGTGTVAGDTAELQSTIQLLKEAGCGLNHAAVGSVKTLIGHTKATAGIAGIIKVAMAIHHQVLPPHFPVEQPNPLLLDQSCPLYIPNEALPWFSAKGENRRAAASAFGFGGTNFHVVLEEYSEEYRPWMLSAVSRNWPAELFMWSGTQATLREQLQQLRQGLLEVPDLVIRHLAYNLWKNWQRSDETITIVACDINDLRKKIDSVLSFLEGKTARLPKGVHHGTATAVEGKLAVLFPGQGSQYPYMFRELAVLFPIFSSYISMADDLLHERFKRRFGDHALLSRFIFPPATFGNQAEQNAEAALKRTDVAQPCLGTVCVAAWELMRALGLSPDMLGGHSYGELVALYAAECLNYDSLLNLSEARGRLIVDEAEKIGKDLGTMAAVHTVREDVEKIIRNIEDIIVANHNAPQQCVLSGTESAIHEALARFAEAGIVTREIPVAAAFHSPLVQPAQIAFAEAIEQVEWRSYSSGTTVFSNTTGAPHPSDILLIKQAMIRHLMEPVEFVRQIETMHQQGARIFVEIGPKSVISGLVRRILHKVQHTTVAIDSGSGELAGLLDACGKLLCAGLNLNFNPLFEGRHCKRAEPFDLTLFQSTSLPLKSAWLLNGSSARRVGDPVKNVGISLDAAITVAEEDKSVAGFAAVEGGNNINKMMIKGEGMTIQETRKPLDGNRRRQMLFEKDPNVMSAYFDTMNRFLETQERVMVTYMGEPTTSLRSWRNNNSLLPSRTGGQFPIVEVKDPMPVQPVRNDVDLFQEKPHLSKVKKSSLSEDSKKSSLSEDGKNVVEASFSFQPDSGQLWIDISKMKEMILSIIEEKTGYPKDMIGLDQNLEADLGIDSIKRVEIVASLVKSLPQNYQVNLDGDQAKLNRVNTINGMIGILDKLQPSQETARPFSISGVGAETDRPRHPLRYVVEAIHEPIDPKAARRFDSGCFVLTQDHLGLADALADVLKKKDCRVLLADSDTIKNATKLQAWCENVQQDQDIITGIVHLAQVGSEWHKPHSQIERWYAQIQANERSLFAMLHHLSDKLKKDAYLFSVSSLGGQFCRECHTKDSLSLQGGAVGLLKSLSQERPGLRVKAIDLDVNQKIADMTGILMAELEVVGGRQEVGYPGGQRTIFKTVQAAVPEERGETSVNDIVVLATGGARGVTAEVLRELALPGNTLLLTGRSVLTQEEPQEIQGLTDFNALRQYFVKQMRAGAMQLKIAEIKRKVMSILNNREMRSNIEDFSKRGATVNYLPVDVNDEESMRRMIETIYEQYGRIDGVVHGAGIIEDKLLADKDQVSWSRVVETKVIGLLLLQKYLRADSLKFFTVFSSVAGRYGNSGQTDYATANELMNRLSCQLKHVWGGRVNIKAFCWGPWGPTLFGSGMVNAFTEAKFNEKGVKLIRAEEGRRLFKDELIQGDNNHVEIICGQGPWEEREAEAGQFEKIKVQDEAWGPMLHHAETTPYIDHSCITLILKDIHPYLRQHCLDKIPVLPMAAAIELMAEAAAHTYPGWMVVEVRDCRLFKGIDFQDTDRRILDIIVKGGPDHRNNGSNEGFELEVTIQTKQAQGQTRYHYRTKFRLERNLPPEWIREPNFFTDVSLTVEKAYTEWLFHGPVFQLIEAIDGLSSGGGSAVLRSSSPSQWLSGTNGSQQWVFDPGVVDAAAQMAILWSRAIRNETSLPVSFKRVVRYCECLPEKLYMIFACTEDQEPHIVKANIYFTDKDHKVAMFIENMVCASSFELNRLTGNAYLPASKESGKGIP